MSTSILPLDREELKQVRNYIIDRLEMEEVNPEGDEILEMVVRKFEGRFPVESSIILDDFRYVIEEVLEG